MEKTGEGVFVLGSFKRSDLKVKLSDLKVLTVSRVSPDCIEVKNAGDYVAEAVQVDIYPGSISEPDEVFPFVQAWQWIPVGRSLQVQLPEELISEPSLRVQFYYDTLIPNPRISDGFNI